MSAKRNKVMIILFLLVLAGCYYDKEELLYPGSNVDCSTVNATFGNVKAILSAQCATAGCHNAGAAAGGVVLETYDQVKAAAGRINQRALVERTMPPAGPLSVSDIAQLKCWLNSGMPNN